MEAIAEGLLSRDYGCKFCAPIRAWCLACATRIWPPSSRKPAGLPRGGQARCFHQVCDRFHGVERAARRRGARGGPSSIAGQAGQAPAIVFERFESFSTTAHSGGIVWPGNADRGCASAEELEQIAQNARPAHRDNSRHRGGPPAAPEAVSILNKRQPPRLQRFLPASKFARRCTTAALIPLRPMRISPRSAAPRLRGSRASLLPEFSRRGVARGAATKNPRNIWRLVDGQR